MTAPQRRGTLFMQSLSYPQADNCLTQPRIHHWQHWWRGGPIQQWPVNSLMATVGDGGQDHGQLFPPELPGWVTLTWVSPRLQPHPLGHCFSRSSPARHAFGLGRLLDPATGHETIPSIKGPLDPTDVPPRRQIIPDQWVFATLAPAVNALKRRRWRKLEIMSETEQSFPIELYKLRSSMQTLNAARSIATRIDLG